MKRLKALTMLGIVAGLLATTGAQAQTEVRFARFFGACEADFGTNLDPALPSNECGVITTLTNIFNAENPDIKVVPEIVEWGPYYEQLAGRIATGDVPDISVMHGDMLINFVNRGLIEPLDAALEEAGIDVNDIAEGPRENVTVDGQIYALPQDFVTWLWHTNSGLMAEAGLGEVNAPIYPTSADEMLAQARQFKEATGKPYLALTLDPTSAARTLYTLMLQNGTPLFPESTKVIDLHSDAAKAAITLLKDMIDEGLLVFKPDWATAFTDFSGGASGNMLGGTWQIGDLVRLSEQTGGQLDGYVAHPFPTVFGEPAVWTSSHSWVMLKGGAGSPEKRAASLKFLKFLFDHNIHWARTGHLPMRTSLMTSPEFTSMPYRLDFASVPPIAQHIPKDVLQQRIIMPFIGEELLAIFQGQKSMDDGIAAAEERVNTYLARLR
ncbi:MAG TPA: extracellular solute-binding protein [Devosia sp.]|nr:extracellular solute-binding protein [Devosia sp.]